MGNLGFTQRTMRAIEGLKKKKKRRVLRSDLWLLEDCFDFILDTVLEQGKTGQKKQCKMLIVYKIQR